MKIVMVMFDSLNRRMLAPFGCNWVKTPNFSRLATRTVMFDNMYVGSMPCIPARRELHTGRYNFLHRSWGPLEPFDDSAMEILRTKGVYTHLVTDHMHYLEDGGATYHNRYNSWECFRGQEMDLWKGAVADPHTPDHLGMVFRHDQINRKYIQDEANTQQAQTFAAGAEFLRINAKEDNWFLHIESFDPHEPFFALEEWREVYPHSWEGPLFDWPVYGPVQENDEAVAHVRYEYAALVTRCDYYLGKILDLMDELELWDDTMLIVNTDHGFLLGEHGWWGKVLMPFYNEIAYIPLFIWDPRCGITGARRSSLVQTIDLALTILDYFCIEVPKDVQGKPLRETLEVDRPVREAALFGIFGGHVNVTDGRYVYMRGPTEKRNRPLFEYTLMPAHMDHLFTVDELRHMRLSEPFSFTKGCALMKIPDTIKVPEYFYDLETHLYDLQTDPEQENPTHEPELEARMIELLTAKLNESDAPPEQFQRLGLDSRR